MSSGRDCSAQAHSFAGARWEARAHHVGHAREYVPEEGKEPGRSSGFQVPRLVQSLGSIYRFRPCIPDLPIPPVGTIVALRYMAHRRVFSNIQFPSWYNQMVALDVVLPVFPAFQFPSWYNTGTKKAPVNRGFLGKSRQRNDVYVSGNVHPFAVFQKPFAEKRIAHRNQTVQVGLPCG